MAVTILATKSSSIFQFSIYLSADVWTETKTGRDVAEDVENLAAEAAQSSIAGCSKTWL